MTVSEPLILYSRADCHLCELVAAMMDRTGVPWQSVDIDGDPDLASKYGIVIPVLRHPESGKELSFPFDEEQLRRFLEEAL
jgi:hypothetical protein